MESCPLFSYVLCLASTPPSVRLAAISALLAGRYYIRWAALRSFKQGNALAFRHLLLYKEGSVLPIKFHRSGFSRPHFAQSQDAVGGFSIVKTRLLVLYCLRFPLSLHKIDMSLPIR